MSVLPPPGSKERLLLLGVASTAVAGLVLSLVTTARLRQGIPVKIEVDPPTRNLVSTTTTQWTSALNQLSSQGVPVRMALGKKGRG